MVDSLPEPTPLTNILTLLIPIFSAICEMASAVFEAAKGVAFLLPLKPSLPADFASKAFPNSSVKVIIVLLYELKNVECPCLAIFFNRFSIAF